MDFAPYQSSPPSALRAMSPPPRSPPLLPQHTRTLSQSPPPPSKIVAGGGRRTYVPVNATPSASRVQQPVSTGPSSSRAQQPSGMYSDGRDAATAAASLGRAEGSLYETSLGFELRVEAALAYLMLPPAGGVLLLLFEWKSDYVRFHAWQSALLFSAVFVVHLIFSWSSVLSWLLFALDVAGIALLVARAWRDAETLDRFEVPFFGSLASSILDDE